MKVLKLRAGSIARYPDMVPAVTVAGLATRIESSPGGTGFGCVCRHFNSLASGTGHGSLGAATEASGRVMVTATFGQKCQCQERFVMHGIEIHGFVKAIFGARRLPAAWQIIPIR